MAVEITVEKTDSQTSNYNTIFFNFLLLSSLK